MFIWGSSSTNLKQQKHLTGSCSVCNHRELVLHATQGYAHFWWIPFIPLKKIFFVTCLNCKSTISNDNLKKITTDIEGESFKTPIRLYLGWLVLFCIALFIYIPSGMKEQNVTQNNNYIIKNESDQLTKNDFIILHDEKELGYILVRIVKVKDNNLNFQMSKYLYKNLSKLNSLAKKSQEIFKDDFYHDHYLEGTLEEIKKEFQLKTIISRNDNTRL